MVKMPSIRGSNNEEESQTDYMSSDCERGNSSDEPDSDSSSEMSETECERRREIYMKHLSEYSLLFSWIPLIDFPLIHR